MSTKKRGRPLAMPAICICTVAVAAVIAFAAAVFMPTQSGYAQPSMGVAAQAAETPQAKPTEEATQIPERLSLQPALNPQGEAAEEGSGNNLLWWIVGLVVLGAIGALVPLLMRRRRSV